MLVLIQNLASFGIITEFFFGIIIIYMLFFGTIVSYSKSSPLLQKIMVYSSVLILGFAVLILAGDFSFYCINLASFSSIFKLNNLNFLIKNLIIMFSIICLFASFPYLIKQKINNFEYFVLLFFVLLGVLLISSANDFITAYLGLELQGLSFYVLASFKKNSSLSVEAGLKYFILGSFSSSLFLFGVSIFYGVLGTVNFDDYFKLLSIIAFENSSQDLKFTGTIENLSLGYLTDPVSSISLNVSFNALKIGLCFIFASLFFKASLAFFHLWAPDVYEGSPTSSTAFFSTIPKLGIFILLIKLCYNNFFILFDSWRYFVVLVALLSIIVGSFAGLEQRKIKSLLVYSSIGHMGYVMLSFCTGTFEGLQGLVLYLIVYLIAILCMWGIFMFTKLKNNYYYKVNKELMDFVLLNKSNKYLNICFCIIIFSLAGFPPLIGFLAKLWVFLSVIEISMYYVAVSALVCSVISTFYYLRFVKIANFENISIGKLYLPIKSEKSVLIVFLSFLVVFFFLDPNFLYLFTHKFSYNPLEFVNLPISEIGIDFLMEFENNESNIDSASSASVSIQGDPGILEYNLMPNPETVKTSGYSSDILATGPRYTPPHRPLYNPYDLRASFNDNFRYPVLYGIRDQKTLQMYYELIESFNNICHFLATIDTNAVRNFYTIELASPFEAEKIVKMYIDNTNNMQSNRVFLENNVLNKSSISKSEILHYHNMVKAQLKVFAAKAEMLPDYACEKKYLSREYNQMLS